MNFAVAYQALVPKLERTKLLICHGYDPDRERIWIEQPDPLPGSPPFAEFVATWEGRWCEFELKGMNSPSQGWGVHYANSEIELAEKIVGQVRTWRKNYNPVVQGSGGGVLEILNSRPPQPAPAFGAPKVYGDLAITDLADFLRQVEHPAILNLSKGRGELAIHLPFALWGYGARAELQKKQGAKPKWDDDRKVWIVSRSAMQDHALNFLDKFGMCWIVQEYREFEVCAPACQHAQGLDCSCSCMGLNHGRGAEGEPWHVVHEAYCFRYGEAKMSARPIYRPDVAAKLGIEPKPAPEPRRPKAKKIKADELPKPPVAQIDDYDQLLDNL